MTARYNLKYVWGISLVAAMGGLLFGYDWVVIGGAKPFFEKYFELGGTALSGCIAVQNSWVTPHSGPGNRVAVEG